MSGIAGIYCLDGSPLEQSALAQMVDLLAHRGPDDSGLFLQGSIGIGHRMLWTTPESLHEKQPLVHWSEDLMITADARIDNRSQLVEILGLEDRPVAEITDSQLILAAYEKWGTGCAEKLLGAFAFAIWDKRRQHFFCARDHLGVKPFYYYYQAKRLFVFASEIKALLILPAIPRRLNEAMVANYLASDLDNRTITFYQGIFRLPAAHTMVINQGGVRITNYWALNPDHEIDFGSDQEYIEAFRFIFTEAVRCRLRSAFPVGASLSGGLDSSSIVCVAHTVLAQSGGDALRTFSYIYDDLPQCDERSFINSVIEQGRLIPHFMRGDLQSPLVDIERAMWHCDEAVVAPNYYLPWGLNQAAQHQGVRVLLDGFDGDTVVSHGFAYLTELAYRSEWSSFAKEASFLADRFQTGKIHVFQEYGTSPLLAHALQHQWLAFAQEADEISTHLPISRFQLWLHQGLKPWLPIGIRNYWRRLHGDNRPVRQSQAILNPRFARQWGLNREQQAMSQSRFKHARTLKDDHWNSLTAGHLSYVLELSNRTAAAFSVEARHPFMDKRLVEFCLAMPNSHKFYQGWSRRILREAMTGILPEAVRLRSHKTSVEDNFVHTLLKFERDRLDKLFINELHLLDPYVDQKAVLGAYRRLVSQKNRLSGDVMTIWKAVNLTMWLRFAGFAA